MKSTAPKGLIVSLVLLLVAALLWYAVAPRLAMARLVAAVQAQDHERVSASIDFPRLRASMIDEARILLQEKAGESREGQLGSAMAERMVVPLIERVVTPAGLRDLMRGSTALSRILPADLLPDASDGPPEMRLRPQGLRDVHLITQTREGEMRLLFERRGLGLKLVGVRLPRAAP